MTGLDPKAALIAYHAALEARDFGAIEGMLADDVFYVSAGLGATRGKAGVMLALRVYFDTHPDHRARDEDVRVEGPRQAFARWQLTATDGASGVTTHRRGTETLHFDAVGRIVRVEVNDLQGSQS